VSSLRTQRLRGESYYRSVAELGVQAAEALEYAHAMGIVHRDIKPGNLMLESFSPLPASGRGAGGEGLRLWITDFGLAKHGDAGLTLSGDLLGTLRYMSPEQALARHGLVDHRTDIYSLGATLYELLLGRPAVAGDDKQEILRQLAFEEPTAPHKLDPKLPRDLDTVLLKCLDKCPDQRYASAQDLADDLKRWLAHKPVQAKPPTLRTRAGKWVKRNRRIVATAMFVTAALVTATAVSVWQAVEARDAQHEAEGARKQAITDAAIARAVNDFLQQDLLGQAAGDLPQDREMSVSPYLTVKEALDRATSRIGQSFQDQPLVEASIRTTIGKAYQNLAETQLAVPHLERAVSIRKAYLGENHSDTIASMGHLATTYEWVGRKSDAVALRQQIIERHIKHLGNDDPMTLRSQLQLIRSLHSAGRQDWETTTQFMEQLFHKQKAICGPQHPDTLDTMHLLAICYGWLDRFEVSTAMHEALLKLRIEKDGPRNRATVSCMISYAQVCQRAGYLDRAEQLLEEAIAQNQMRDDSLNRREGDANLRGWLAKTLLLQKRYSEAEPLIRNTVSYFEKVHPDSARRYYWISILGAILTGQMKYSEAEPLLLQGYEGMKQREHLIQPNEKCRVEEVGERIVRFYEATGQTENADAWQAKVKPKLPDAASPPSK
jgi:tetratricopeptide (TPR) repeat protein